MLEKMIEKAEMRASEQKQKVAGMEAQVNSMRKSLEQAQGAFNNEVVELAVRNRLTESLKEAMAEKTKEEINGSEVLDNNGGPTGPEHADNIRGLPAPDRASKTIAPVPK
ncbi:MAG: hypothetical protein ACTSXE_05030 [Candidatus Thorarchaeota archaeon]